MKHSLKKQILFIFAITSFFILLIFGFLFYYFFYDNIISLAKQNLSIQAKQIKNSLHDTEFRDIHSTYAFAIIKNNEILYKSKNFDFNGKFDFENNQFYLLGLEDDAIYSLKSDDLFILTYQKHINEPLEQTLHIIIILEIVLYFILLFLVSRILNKIFNPINQISSNIKILSIENFTTFLPTSNNKNEISILIDTFNDMVSRLKDGVVKIQRFNSDVSHELKSPLTIINANIDLALKNTQSEQFYINTLKKIQTQSNNILQIVQNLLLLTRVKNTQKHTKCDLNNILLTAIDNLTSFANEQQITLQINEFEKSIKNSNEYLIYAIFFNIIENAIKYSHKNTKVLISLYNKQKIHFIVKDQGIGIDESEIKNITDRFYRVDKSRNKNISGFGLGLSIVENSVKLLDGELKISSKLGIGTTIEVVL